MEWHILNPEKKKNCQHRLTRLAMHNWGSTKPFYHKQKLKEFMTIEPALQKILHIEQEDKRNQANTAKNKSH
jgi:hypothetical protein